MSERLGQDDGYAVERHVEDERPSRAALAQRSGVAAALGAVMASVPAGAVYYASHRNLALPWAMLFVRFITWLIVTAGSVGYGGVFGALWVASRRPGSLAFVAGGTVGGAIACLAPGAFAASYFGSMDAPFWGGPNLVAAIAGSAYLASAINAKRMTSVSVGRAIVLCAAPAPFGLVVGLLLVALIPSEPVRIDTDLLFDPRFLALLGAMAGAMFGAIVGFWMTSTAALCLRTTGRNVRQLVS